MSLLKLINDLESKIKNNDVSVQRIKHPELLISSLKELQNIIGMDRLKKDVASQTKRLIQKINTGERKTEKLSTVLYGPPGTGKSMVAVILAKIWYSLGYLEKSEPEKSNFMTNLEDPQTFSAYLIVFTILVQLFVIILKILSYVGRRAQYAFVFLVVFTILFMMVDTDDEVDRARSLAKGEIRDDQLITITSRKDFVGEYVGWSAPKTSKMMRDNSGKVIFVDEAYTLMQDQRDVFGKEAITEMTKYMSEHPESCIVIFAGYKNEIERMFEFQPGLPERFMWHFECDPYTPSELTRIFELQAKKTGWEVFDKDKLTKIIEDNIQYFKACGRDCERLLNFSQMDASDRYEDLNSTVPKKLYFDHYLHGMEKLKKNTSGARKDVAVYDEGAAMRQIYQRLFDT